MKEKKCCKYLDNARFTALDAKFVTRFRLSPNFTSDYGWIVIWKLNSFVDEISDIIIVRLKSSDSEASLNSRYRA